jgi:glycerol-3-phosphate acyltransferase PlsY
VGRLFFPSMEAFLRLLIPSLLGYMLGSVSFAMLLARSRGVDLRSIGSGNLGATNAGRALGRNSGIMVYFLDAAKGFLPAWLGVRYFELNSGMAYFEMDTAVLAASGAFLGHIWPIWFKFRGGKGVATLSGGLIALNPFIPLIAGIAMAVAVVFTRFMSLGSIIFGLSLPWAAFFLQVPMPVFYLSLFAGLCLLFTHRSNLARLKQGTESRIGDPRK